MSITWDASTYDSAHSYVWRLGAGVIDLLAPQPGERILDLGSGTGHLTAQIAQRGAIVEGIDASAEMLAAARANYPALSFRLADARNFEVPAPVDAVFSNATLHWVDDPDAAAKCIARALRPGGRFVAEFGGAGNIKEISQAISAGLAAVGAPPFEQLSPWYFPSIAAYAAVLERAGLEVTFATLFDRPTVIDAGLQSWLEMYGTLFLDAVPPSRRQAFFDAAEKAGRPTLFKEGKWVADYRRIQVVAIRH